MLFFFGEGLFFFKSEKYIYILLWDTKGAPNPYTCKSIITGYRIFTPQCKLGAQKARETRRSLAT